MPVAAQLAPSPIIHLGGPLGGSDDVGEHHGGQHPIRLQPTAFARYEFLDLVRDDALRLLIKHQMVGAGNRRVLGPGYVLG